MPTVKSLCNLARQSTRARSYERAIELAQHVLEYYPKSIEAHCVLGEVCAERGDFGEAAQYFKLVLSADPENVDALVGLGISYSEQGSLEGAIVELERALELQPEDSQIREEVLRLGELQDSVPRDRIKPTRAALGRIYLRSGLYTRAEKELRAVFEADPTRLDVAVGLAEALWRAELFADTAQVCESILSLAPDCLKAKLLFADMCFAGVASGDPHAMSADARSLDPDNRMASTLFSETPSASRWVVAPAELPLPSGSELATELEERDEVGEESIEQEGPEEITADSPSVEAAAVDESGKPHEAEPASAPVRKETDLRLAIARLRSVVVARPDDHASRLSLAMALGRLGEIDEALKEFVYLLVEAPEVTPQIISGVKELLDGSIAHPKLHRLLADAYMKDGAVGEAIEHYALASEKEAK